VWRPWRRSRKPECRALRWRSEQRYEHRCTSCRYRHLKSTASNGNAAANPSSSNNWPAVAVWGTDYDFSKAGSFHATIKSPQEGSANRFGFYLGYNDPGDGLFIGYDSDGWFWQTRYSLLLFH